MALMTPEQVARQQASAQRQHTYSLQAQQQQHARNYAAGYFNETAPGQPTDNRYGYLPGGQSMSYNARSGQIYSGYNQGQNAYDLYPMQQRSRPLNSYGGNPNAARSAQSHWDDLWGTGNLTAPNAAYNQRNILGGY